MSRGVKLVLYPLILGGLLLGNLHLAVDSRRAAAHAAEVENGGEWSGNWWGNYHWHKSTIYSLVRSSNTEAIRAVNRWNGLTDLKLPSSSSHTDISILRGSYGYTGWRGLASIKSLARDRHCNGGYCEIKHCHATLNTTYSGSAWRYEGTYCMEMGHCFGLAHDSDNGCMNSSAMNAGTSNAPSSGNIADINRRY